MLPLPYQLAAIILGFACCLVGHLFLRRLIDARTCYRLTLLGFAACAALSLAAYFFGGAR